jgi:23S rRNA G2069 N7-methylase RlmK/C1962 C5-methylase RlmI
MTRADFQRMALDLQRRLPDTLIDRAMRRLPPAVFALESARIGSALKARRQTLPQAADAFYRHLAHEPNLGGTAQAERFVVHRYHDSTTVRVYSSAQSQAAAPNDSLRFQRTYFATETRKLRLDGLDGNDVFEVATTGRKRPMRLHLYGGEGQDQLRLQGNRRRLRFFDAASDLTAAGIHRPYLPRKNHRPYDRLSDD